VTHWCTLRDSVTFSCSSYYRFILIVSDQVQLLYIRQKHSLFYFFHFPDFSLTTFKFSDFPWFFRWIATVSIHGHTVSCSHVIMPSVMLSSSSLLFLAWYLLQTHSWFSYMTKKHWSLVFWTRREYFESRHLLIVYSCACVSFVGGDDTQRNSLYSVVHSVQLYVWTASCSGARGSRRAHGVAGMCAVWSRLLLATRRRRLLLAFVPTEQQTQTSDVPSLGWSA